ncbi:hypothetical protein KGM_200855 [Danaus plexippus plexippus]|uniref:Uncharacterized protein n=1 Tax=Danaus plexippus plexippus TaxID=278856 RepID=A0A212EV68_DANPL|nr:hypothetical protein KGM_200855 [Danaus plexippus plexippus]
MADASSSVRVKKIPDNLYEVCLTNLVNFLQKCKCERNDLRYLPDSILMDVYYKTVAVPDVVEHAKGVCDADGSS